MCVALENTKQNKKKKQSYTTITTTYQWKFSEIINIIFGIANL